MSIVKVRNAGSLVLNVRYCLRVAVDYGVQSVQKIKTHIILENQHRFIEFIPDYFLFIQKSTYRKICHKMCIVWRPLIEILAHAVFVSARYFGSRARYNCGRYFNGTSILIFLCLSFNSRYTNFSLRKPNAS